MSGIIQLLSATVANQIAAGEVIRRPASVVKELMENSVDAGSKDIRVGIKDGGKTWIHITDNGCGMSKTDARICFERHATSKISQTEDLMHIKTLGFRGEALASIVAVAQVVVRTRRQEDEVGTEVLMSATEPVQQEPYACPAGTSITVKNLFYNVPARRRFLKNNSVELKHIIYEIQRIALARPDISFVLNHNGIEIYNLPVGSYKVRIVNIFGKGISQNLMSVETSTSLIRIRGFIGKPEHARKTAGEQFFFINDRFMRHPYFHKAVISAYEKILPPETLPSYFLYFEAEPESIDVNIHPTKTEIKFENEGIIYQIINAAVREALGKFNIMPSIDFDSENSFEIPAYQGERAVPIPPPDTYNPDYNPFDEERKPPLTWSDGQDMDVNLKNWESLYEGGTSYASSGMQSREGDQHSMDMPVTPGDESFIQLRGKYIVTPVKSGLMLVDQKRAHERVLYESYIRSFALNIPAAQRSLFPETLETNTADYLILQEISGDLRTIGFDLSDLGSNTFVINGCPASNKKLSAKELIERFLEQYKSTGRDMKANARERMATSLAAANAIDYGEKLTSEAMRELVDNLFACEEPNYSPAGKPVVSIMVLEELEKRFR